MKLPAGILPSDLDIEIFADPENFGKCFFIQRGCTQPFYELPKEVLPALYDECLNDKKAVKGLMLMDVDSENWVEQFNYCNRGKIDGIPDIYRSGKTTTEYFDCGRRGVCPGEGLCCKPLSIDGVKITHRERECLSYIKSGKTDKQIKVQMGFTSQASVNSLMERLRNKLNVSNRTEMAVIANQIGV